MSSSSFLRRTARSLRFSPTHRAILRSRRAFRGGRNLPLSPSSQFISRSSSFSSPRADLLHLPSLLQITLESTYISALPPSPSTSTQQQGSTYPFPPTPGLVPSTPTASLSPPRITTSSPSGGGGRGLSPGPTPSARNFPPQTPNPTPSTGSTEERRYARAEGVPVWSATWGSTPKKKKEVILGRIEGEASWIAVWELEAPVGEYRVHFAVLKSTHVSRSGPKLTLALIWIR